MSPMQGPPDLGDQTILGKAFYALLGVLAVAFWRAWDFVNKRLVDHDTKIEARMTEADHVREQAATLRVLEHIEQRLTDQASAIGDRVSVGEHTRVRDGLRDLHKKVEEMRVETALQHGEVLTAQQVMKNEIQHDMNKQTSELREAMRDMVVTASRSIPPR